MARGVRCGVRARRFAALVAALATTACARDPALPDARGEAHAAAGGVSVYVPRIVEPAGDVAALYFVVVDREQRGDRLIGVESAVGEAMLHETVDAQGLARMRRAQRGLAVPARGELRLEPGGPHVMLMGLREPLAAGSRVRVTLEFERVGRLLLEVPVVGADEEAAIALREAGPATRATDAGGGADERIP
jgi:hypothetical protein